jgi:hypothetical protein
MSIDAMSASSGGISSRCDATSVFSAAIARLARGIERCGHSIARNDGATRAVGLAIERQARAIASRTLAIESRRHVIVAYLSLNEEVEYESLCLGAAAETLR